MSEGNTLERYDVIVLGGGKGGKTLAIELGQRGVRTALIEQSVEIRGEPLLKGIHKQLVLGQHIDGTSLELRERVELMGWAPPADWRTWVLLGAVVDGVGLPVHFSHGEGDLALPLTLRKFVNNTRREYAFELPSGGPLSVFVLAPVSRPGNSC